MRRKARIDDNQQSVVKSLRQIPGVSVAVTSSLGNGFPDLVIARSGVNYLVELKDGAKSKSRKKLTPDEEEFKNTWQGSYHVAESLEDILRLLEIGSG